VSSRSDADWLNDELSGVRARLGTDVVHRTFGDRAVVLNLRTGAYHGLNHTAYTMLDVMTASSSLEIALDGLAARYDTPRDELRRDLVALCGMLIDRRLVEVCASQDGAN